MRELDLIAIIGPGRLGTALGAALRGAGLHVQGPLGRGEQPDGAATLVLLTVPDHAIAAAAAAVAPSPLVGHCSGATTLEPISRAGHRALSLHPLMTVPGQGATDFTGAGAAVAGEIRVAAELARRLGMRPIEVADADRAAYHAAASIASNFLVTVEAAAERVAATAGVTRESLVPLVRATVENWAAQGSAALTGPIARGDDATVQRHRTVLRERLPDLLPLYDALAEATAA